MSDSRHGAGILLACVGLACTLAVPPAHAQLVVTKYDNSLPANSDSSSTAGRIPRGIGGTADDNHASGYGSVLYEDGMYKSWYGGHDGSKWRIFHATSPDGIVWTKYDNSAPSTSNLTNYNGRIGIGSSGKGDDVHTLGLKVIKDGGIYKGWYSGHDGSNWRGYYATSTNGLTWVKYDNTVAPDSNLTNYNGQIGQGIGGTGDDDHVRPGTVMKDGGIYKMWYGGHDGSSWRAYYATSTNGLTWVKYDNSVPAISDGSSTNGRVPLGNTGTGDDAGVLPNCVIKDDEAYHMWYSGYDGTYWRIYYATSPDGLVWTKVNNAIPGRSNDASTDGRIPLGISDTADDRHAIAPQGILENGAVFKLWYGGSDNSLYRIYYATALSQTPGIANIAATNVTYTRARLLGNLLHQGTNNLEVRVYWGTNNAGYDENSWQTNAVLGDLDTGIVTNEALYLDPNTVYYYRFYATNSAGEDWADTVGVFTTVTASALAVDVLPATGIGITNVTIHGRVLHKGGAENPFVYFCLGLSDDGTDATSDWDRVEYVGNSYDALDYFSTNLYGLQSGSNYFCRTYVTNSIGEDWSDNAITFKTITLPTVTNHGAIYAQTVATLQGEILDMGEDAPYVWFHYWPDAGATSVVAKGIQTGFFSTSWTGLTASSTYHYTIQASNLAGTVWTSTNDFTTPAAGEGRDWYVSRNGDGSSGLSWDSAVTNIQTALDGATSNDTVYLAGHTFPRTNQLDWSASHITIRGGYEATGGIGPGTNNPALWPSVIRRALGNIRLLYINSVTNGAIEDVTFANGYNVSTADAVSKSGGGLYITGCTNLTISRCIITNNIASGRKNTYNKGGGIYAQTSYVTMEDCIVTKNKIQATLNNFSGYAWGGGIYVASGVWTIRNTIFWDNEAYGNNNGGSHGGGLDLAGGPHRLSNCLIAKNDCTGLASKSHRSDGLRVGGTGALIENCTIVDNGIYNAFSPPTPEGLRGNASTVVSNSILWGNGDDVVIVTEIYYSCVEDGDNKGAAGCVDDDPQFVDSEHYHLRSVHGAYTNGFFSGGSWHTSADTSPLIDACDTSIAPTNEPYPNGVVVNMGAYGNSTVASKSAPMAITNLAAYGISDTSATLKGKVVRMGSPDVHVWFYWGWINGTNNAVAWQTNGYAGMVSSPSTISLTISNLTINSNYFFTCYASNASSETAWAQPSSNFIAQLSPPELQAVGVVNETSTLPWLQGLITSTGGDTPDAFICWGSSDGGFDTNTWENVIPMGAKTGSFSNQIATVAGSNYWYNCYATNGYGDNWGSAISFGHYLIRYVNPSASGADNGYDWANGYTDIETALAECSDSRTNIIYLVGGTYGRSTQLSIDSSHVRLLGGWQGSGNPGTRNPQKWPTLLSALVGSIRFLSVNAVEDVLIHGLGMKGANITGDGGGVYVVNSTNVIIEDCYIDDSTATGNGGGVYISGDNCHLINCVLTRCEAVNGGGVYIAGGSHSLTNCLIVQNAGSTAGAGVHIAAGTTVVANNTIAGNQGEGIKGNAGTIVRNSILWGNVDDAVGLAAGNLYYCDIEDGDNDGTNGCISQDPSFDWAFYLSPNSVCINTGGATAVSLALDTLTTLTNGVTDQDTVDLGYHYSTGWKELYVSDLFVSTSGDDANSGTNAADAFRTITKSLAVARVGSRIHVAAGSYTNGSETFPLRLDNPRVALIGAGTNTIIDGTGGNTRLLNIVDAYQSMVETLTIRDGNYVLGADANAYGGGIYISDAKEITIASCVIDNNKAEAGKNTWSRGGGVYSKLSTVSMTDCIVKNNKVRTTGNNNSGNGYGGGLYVDSGVWTIRRSIFWNNEQYSMNNGGGHGGAIYALGGPHTIENCLIAFNDCTGRADRSHTGDGMLFAGSGGTVRNCTVVSNGLFNVASTPEGIRGNASVIVSNCIVWGNGTDLFAVSNYNLSYSIVQDGNNEGVSGCISNDPEFVDATYFHLKSKKGHYVAGYFDGGSWANSSGDTSPGIDGGAPGDDESLEPFPNGRRINMGCYGNTSVASISLEAVGTIFIFR